MSFTLKYAQSGVVPSTGLRTLILDHLKDNWGAFAAVNPNADGILFGTRFNKVDLNMIIIKRLKVNSPPQTIGAGRYRFTALFKCHIWNFDHDAEAKQEAMENEIKRIIKTNESALMADGIDEIHIDDDFIEVETGTEAKMNDALAADSRLAYHSVGTITLIYDMYKSN